MSAYCDHETTPWIDVAPYLPDGGHMLREALKLMLKMKQEWNPKICKMMTVPVMGKERRRTTLRNPLSAIRKENWAGGSPGFVRRRERAPVEATTARSDLTSDLR